METIKPTNDPPKESSVINQWIAILICNLISANTGLVTGWISPAIVEFSQPESHFSDVTEDEKAWLASMMPLGAFFGATISAPISDKLGRMTSIVLWSFAFMINSLCIIFGDHFNYIQIGRFLSGCGIAGCMANVSAYSGETAIPRIRGTLASLFSVTYTTGVTSAFAIGGFVNYKTTAWVMLFIAVANIVLCLLIVPETPYILVKMGKIDKAASSLAWLRRLDVNDDEVKTEIAKLKADCEKKPISAINAAKILIFDKAQRKGFLLCMMLFFIQSFSGMFTIHSYSLTIFIEGGIDLSPPAATTLYGCIQVSGTLTATKIIDKWGRKSLMVISMIFVSIALMSLATFFYLKSINMDLSGYNWVPVAILCSCVFIYSSGAAAVPFVYVSDVLSNEVRSFGSMIVFMSIYFYAFLLLRFFAPFTQYFGFHTIFYVFGVFSGIGGFLSLMIPETKGKSIEEVMEIMRK